MNVEHKDRWASVYAQMAIVLLALITLRLWMTPGSLISAAQADPGAPAEQMITEVRVSKMEQLISEVKTANNTLGQIQEKLNNGTITVQMAEKDANHEGSRKEAKPGKPK